MHIRIQILKSDDTYVFMQFKCELYFNNAVHRFGTSFCGVIENICKDNKLYV